MTIWDKLIDLERQVREISQDIGLNVTISASHEQDLDGAEVSDHNLGVVHRTFHKKDNTEHEVWDRYYYNNRPAEYETEVDKGYAEAFLDIYRYERPEKQEEEKEDDVVFR